MTGQSCKGFSVDSLDRKIVEFLLEDGRASFAAIGADIGLSAPAVKRRMDRLVASGAIRGFTAVIAPEHLGWTTAAYVQVHCKGNVSPEELRRTMIGIPEVHKAATVSGDADALLYILASDVRHLERALERVRVEAANVEHTETAIVLSQLIDR